MSRGLAAPARASVTMVMTMFQAADDEQQSSGAAVEPGPYALVVKIANNNVW